MLKVIVEIPRELADEMKANMSKETDIPVSDISDTMLINEAIWNSTLFASSSMPDVPDRIKIIDTKRR